MDDSTFRVSNPTLRKTALRDYTTYELRSSGAAGERQVQRRYSDFLWLHDTLRQRNSGCIIPPLPKKQFLGRFHPQFIENRIRGLEKFLTKVASHPVLGQEHYLHSFLESDDIALVKKLAESSQSSDDAGVINWLQTKKNVLTASESSMVKSQTMIETEARIQPIIDHMADAVKYAPKAVENGVALQKQHSSVVALRQKVGSTLNSLYEVDVNRDHDPVPALQHMSLANVDESHIEHVNIEVMEPLQRYNSTVFALRASVTSQRNKRANHIAANSAIQKESVRNPNHEELVAKASRCLNEYVDASNRLDDDYMRYEEDRREELLSLLLSFANLNLQYHQNSSTVWSEFEASLTADGTVLSNTFTLSNYVNTSSVSSSQTKNSSSLLDLQEDEDELKGRESDFYESV